MQPHQPNHIPAGTRYWHILLSLFLLIYGGAGLYGGALYLPTRRDGITLHGWSVGIMYLAFVMASLNLLSVVVDHYDTRNNEHDYRRFAKVTQVLGWVLFVSGLIVGMVLREITR